VTRIVHLTKYLPSFAGGIERATAGLAEAGGASGAEVTIVGAAHGELSKVPRGWLALPILFHAGPAPVVPGYFGLAKLLDESDVVHLHLPNPVAELAVLSYLVRRPRNCRPRLIPVWHAPIVRWPRLGALWSALVHRVLFRASQAVLVASPQLAELGKKAHPGVDFQVLPFGVPAAQREPEFTSLAQSDLFHIVAVGRLVRYKGFDRLLEALSKLSGGWRLTLVGDGPQKEALHLLAERLGIAEKICWREDADDEEKNRLLSSCQLFVLPSQTQAECFGLVVAEAFAHGRPVLTTDLSTGLAFLARRGECGASIPVGSTEALTQALARLRDDAMARVRAGRANYEFWKRELAPPVFLNRYQTFLAAVAEGARPSAELSSNAAPLAIP
jgi:glycosyltransferase involved in cell wall biosynthesis